MIYLKEKYNNEAEFWMDVHTVTRDNAACISQMLLDITSNPIIIPTIELRSTVSSFRARIERVKSDLLAAQQKARDLHKDLENVKFHGPAFTNQSRPSINACFVVDSTFDSGLGAIGMVLAHQIEMCRNTLDHTYIHNRFSSDVARIIKEFREYIRDGILSFGIQEYTHISGARDDWDAERAAA